MGLSASAAAWFLPAVIPITFYVAWSDMRSMKIPNAAVYALVFAYAILGLIALPFTDYLWHWIHLIVVLIIGIILNAGGIMGAGDAKFAAAASPLIYIADLRLVLMVFAASLLAGYATHRIAKYTPLHRQVPDWKSWETGKQFPMGFPLAMTLLFYLLIVLWYR